MRSRATVRAAAATTLFAGTLGVLIAVTVFGLTRIGDQMLESISVLPMDWGEHHLDILIDIAIAASVPFVAWFCVWFFKKAVDAESRLAGYKYAPPPEKHPETAARGDGDLKRSTRS